jgi:hypothetical protein
MENEMRMRISEFQLAQILLPWKEDGRRNLREAGWNFRYATSDMQLPICNSIDVGMRMRKCGNVKMRKCGNVKMQKCGNAEVEVQGSRCGMLIFADVEVEMRMSKSELQHVQILLPGKALTLSTLQDVEQHK